MRARQVIPGGVGLAFRLTVLLPGDLTVAQNQGCSWGTYTDAVMFN